MTSDRAQSADATGGDEDEAPDWRSIFFGQLTPQEQARWSLDQLERHKEFYAERVAAERDFAFQQIEKYGQRVILLVFTLNAGGIVLLLTLVGNIQSEVTPWGALINSFKPSFYYFAIGLIFAVLTPTFGYFNGLAIVRYWHEPAALYNWLRDADPDAVYEELRRRANETVRWTQHCAIATAFGAAIFFVLGLLSAMSANIPPG